MGRRVKVGFASAPRTAWSALARQLACTFAHCTQLACTFAHSWRAKPHSWRAALHTDLLTPPFKKTRGVSALACRFARQMVGVKSRVKANLYLACIFARQPRCIFAHRFLRADNFFRGRSKFSGVHFYTLAPRWRELLHARLACICARHQQAGVDFYTPMACICARSRWGANARIWGALRSV